MIELIKFILSDIAAFLGTAILLAIISKFRLFTINITKGGSSDLVNAIMNNAKEDTTE